MALSGQNEPLIKHPLVTQSGQLPKAENICALAVTELSLWNHVARFMKKHEEVHRSIWMNCADTYEQKLQTRASKNYASSNATAP
jgi:predicted secreted Zn-dependent protease